MKFLVDAQLPVRLSPVATGSITNVALLALFELHLGAIVDALGEAAFVELDRTSLIVH